MSAILRAVAFVVGATSAAWAFLVLGDPSSAPTWDSPVSMLGWPFRVLVGEGMLHWVALALSSFSAGTVLMALAVGLPAPGVDDATPRSIAPAWRRGDRWIILLILAAAAALLPLGWSTPYRGVATWAVVILGGLGLAFAADSRRGTALGNPFPARFETLTVLGLAAAAMLWVAYDIGDWRWSGTPDEARFFEVAEQMTRGATRFFLLSEKGVFGYHPVLGSFYQAAFMRLFGAEGFGWRLSSAFALGIAVPFAYLLGRELFGRRAGLVAAILLGASPLAVSFAHFGYNNIHVVPVLCAALAMVAWSARRRSLAGAFLAGIVAGLGWFTYYPARIVALLAVLLARSLGALPLRRGDRAMTVALLAGAAVTAFPIFLRPDRIVRHMLQQTAMGAPEAGPEAGIAAVLRMAGHWVLSLFYGIWARETHMQANPMLDPITATASVVGLWLTLAALLRGRRAGVLALLYLLGAFLVGGFSQYDTPPITRLLFLTPLSALLAAFAIERVLSRLDALAAGRRAAGIAAALIVGVAVATGAADVRYQSRVRHHGYGLGTTSELIRRVRELPRDTAVVYVQRQDTFMADVDLIATQYDWGKRLIYLRPFDARFESTLAESTTPLAVFLDLEDPLDRSMAEELMKHRFPGVTWRDSDPDTSWSLRTAFVPAGSARTNECPVLPSYCPP